MQPSARKFGNAVKNCINENPFVAIATVKTKTVSFGGLGFGNGIFAEITTTHALPDSLKEKLRVIQAEFESQADQGNHFIIDLAGKAYPFGGKIVQKTS